MEPTIPEVYSSATAGPYAVASIGQITLDVWDRVALLRRIDAALTGTDLPIVLVSVNLDHVNRFGPSRAPRLPHGRGERVQWSAIVDGRPVARALRRHPAARRDGAGPALLPGSELLEPILALAAARRLRVGLVGASPAARAAWAGALDRVAPGTVVVGTRGVDWAWLDQPGSMGELAADVATWRADVLVVSLGKPRQELWLREHMVATGAAVALPFGSAVEYLTGTTRRPPPWARRHGLEWAVRLLAEPRRLGRRYLVQAPVALAFLRRTLTVEPVPDHSSDR